MFSYSLVTLLGLAVSLPISTSLAAYLDITSPGTGSHWYSGHSYPVTWDTSDPTGETSGAIYLASGGVIQYDLTLASDVNLADGTVSVIPPTVHTAPYQVALVSDSGYTTYSQSFAVIGTPE